MKIKILYSISLLLLFTTMLSLYVCFTIQNPICERIHLSEQLNSSGMVVRVPNAETAKKIADAVLITNPYYDPLYNYDNYEVRLVENDTVWQVLYHPSRQTETVIYAVDFSISFLIRKDNAMVL